MSRPRRGHQGWWRQREVKLRREVGAGVVSTANGLRNARLHKREQGGVQGSQRGGGDAGRGACPSVPRGAQRPLEGGQGSDRVTSATWKWP